MANFVIPFFYRNSKHIIIFCTLVMENIIKKDIVIKKSTKKCTSTNKIHTLAFYIAQTCRTFSNKTQN